MKPDDHRRILVVDDDKAMSRTLCDVLRLAGWAPESASSGEEALAVLRRVEGSSYCAVLMDVRMGGMSGVDALKAIRAQWPALPVVLMTAYASADMLSDAVASGVTRVLHKPLQIPDLLEVLTVACPSRRVLLIIDDDRDFRQSLTTLLVARGYTVHQAGSLDLALEQLGSCTPAAVLLDLKLGVLDPPQLVSAIRNATSDTPIIVCTGHPQLLDQVLSSNATDRVNGFVIKPFAPDQLTAVLDAAIA